MMKENAAPEGEILVALRGQYALVSVRGQILDPSSDTELVNDSPFGTDGTDFRVLNGFRTEFRDLDADQGRSGWEISGSVVEVGTQDLVTGGAVVLSCGLSERETEEITVDVGSRGTFDGTCSSRAQSVRLIFVPDYEGSLYNGATTERYTFR